MAAAQAADYAVIFLGLGLCNPYSGLTSSHMHPYRSNTGSRGALRDTNIIIVFIASFVLQGLDRYFITLPGVQDELAQVSHSHLKYCISSAD